MSEAEDTQRCHEQVGVWEHLTVKGAMLILTPKIFSLRLSFVNSVTNREEPALLVKWVCSLHLRACVVSASCTDHDPERERSLRAFRLISQSNRILTVVHLPKAETVLLSQL